MELFLMYLWLKLDLVHGIFSALFVCVVLAGLGWLFVYGINIPIYESTQKEYRERHKQPFKKYGKPVVIVALCGLLFNILVPSSKDMAILVGTHIAIETIKSPEGVKIGKILRNKANEFLDEQLKAVK